MDGIRKKEVKSLKSRHFESRFLALKFFDLLEIEEVEMFTEGKILTGVTREGTRVFLNPKMANRHGLIAGATGTGKTVTLKVLAESFSEMGVPVFLADVKGDISGMCQAGTPTESILERLKSLGIADFPFRAFPVRFWDVYGEAGIPVRTTVSEMGPLLISRLLGLTKVQEGVLNLVFQIADDSGRLLLDWKDLRSMLIYVGNRNKEFTLEYGNISKQSIGAIQRALYAVENAGGEVFFGEPDLQLEDWIQTDSSGRGFINILDCVTLFHHPVLYATFLLWMLTELFERLPEVGDLEKPKLVFFFDEAHLLFTDAPKALVQKIEQVVRLIRSKGVGVFFVTQKPTDIPDSVLAQLGNRLQHALRAYTPAEQKGVSAAAKSFRKNSAFDTESAITNLGTGEALVSFLDESGKPEVVQIAKILPPSSFMGPADEQLKTDLTKNCELYQKYAQIVDRYSAFEMIEEENAQAEAAELERKEAEEAQRTVSRRPAASRTSGYGSGTSRRVGRPRKTAMEKAVDQTMNTIGREFGKGIVRTLLGLFIRKK